MSSKALAVACLLGIAPVWAEAMPVALTEERRAEIEENHQYPPESELEPLPSLDPDEREEMRERLETLERLYEIKLREAWVEHHGLDSVADLFAHDKRHYRTRREYQYQARAELRPEHEQWLFETAWGLLEEEPPDWDTLWEVFNVLEHTGAHPEREALARYLLSLPIEPNLQRQNVKMRARQYVLDYWPGEAPRIVETLLTLPVQPAVRDILPIPEGKERTRELQEVEAQTAGGTRRDLSRLRPWPGRAAELAARMEGSVQAGEYSLDYTVGPAHNVVEDGGHKILERVRAYADTESPAFEHLRRPPEEAIAPEPGLAEDERDELAERLEALHELYRVKILEARTGRTGEDLDEWWLAAHRVGHEPRRRELHTFWQARMTVDISIGPRHTSWLYPTLDGLLDEEPVDWKLVKRAMSILSHGAPHSESERLARRILQQPMPGVRDADHLGAALAALHYYLRYWPDDAPETVAALLTLPTQPPNRDLLSIQQDQHPAEDVIARYAAEFRQAIAQLSAAEAYDRMMELAAEVEGAVAADAYQLDSDAERLITNMTRIVERAN